MKQSHATKSRPDPPIPTIDCNLNASPGAELACAICTGADPPQQRNQHSDVCRPDDVGNVSSMSMSRLPIRRSGPRGTERSASALRSYMSRIRRREKGARVAAAW